MASGRNDDGQAPASPEGCDKRNGMQVGCDWLLLGHILVTSGCV